MRHVLSSLAIVASVFLVGCTVRATALRDVTLAHQWTAPEDQQRKTPVLLFPFDDLRGATFMTSTPLWPIWNRWNYRYPEASYVLRGSGVGGDTALVGDIAHSMPALLARALRDSRVTPNVNVLDEVSRDADLKAYPVHLRGRVKTWSCEDAMNSLPGVLLGYVGIPFGKRTMRANFEMDVIQSKTGKVLATHVYKDRRSQPFSLYYNLENGQTLALETLDTVVRAMVEDIAKDI